MNSLLHHIVRDSQVDALDELRKQTDILQETISIDCSSELHHCVCSTNFEYFRKPEHVLQCIEKRKCFHCQRYRAMHREHEVITASTNLLLVAAALGKFEIFKYLHKNGCNIESKTGIFELRPLHLTIANGHFHIFCYLLAQNVNVNATARSHGTRFSALMLAVMYRQEDMVRHLLMTKGINLSYRNSLSQSPVLFAVQNNNLDLVDLLLNAEMAILDKTLPSGHLRKLHHPYAMLEAIRQDNPTALEKLLENRTKVNFVFRGYHTQTTGTTLAVVRNSYRCLKLLLDYGADYEFEVDVITALEWAKHLRWTEAVEVLRDAVYGTCSMHSQDTSPNESCEEGNDVDGNDRCICDAKENFLSGCICVQNENKSPNAMIGIWSLVKWLDVSDAIGRLVSRGYDVNFQDELGRTSLHMAVEEQNVPGVRALIQLGADPNLADACFATPFWHAVFWDKESMINELLFANVETECVAKEDAYRIGLPWSSNDPSLDHEEMVFSESVVSTLTCAVRKNFCNTVRLLLETGYDVRGDDIPELLTQTCLKTEMKAILQEHVSQPKSLFKNSRNFIRRVCGLKIHKLLNDIDLPQRVKDCLLLRDLIDLKIEPVMENL